MVSLTDFLDTFKTSQTVLGRVQLAIWMLCWTGIFSSSLIYYSNERFYFTCESSGSKNLYKEMCYDNYNAQVVPEVTPLTLINLIGFVPIIIWIVFAIVITRCVSNRDQEQDGAHVPLNEEPPERARVGCDCSLFVIYILQILFRLVVFVGGFILLHHYQKQKPQKNYKCILKNNGNSTTNSFDCWDSRSSEKSAVNYGLMALLVISFVMAIVEIIYLRCRCRSWKCPIDDDFVSFLKNETRGFDFPYYIKLQADNHISSTVILKWRYDDEGKEHNILHGERNYDILLEIKGNARFESCKFTAFDQDKNCAVKINGKKDLEVYPRREQRAQDLVFEQDTIECLTKASVLLKELYQKELEERVLCNPKSKNSFKTVARNEFHVDLALLDSKEVDKDWLQSDRQYHLATYEHDKEQLTYNDLMTDNEAFVILRGIAGIGKTSLIDYMLLQWASGHLWNGGETSRFNFVFRFQCRELNGCETKISIKELFEKFYSKVFKQISFEDLTKHGENVLIILDGLDEFSKQEELLKSVPAKVEDEISIGSVLHIVLKTVGGCFSSQKTIVASRPESADNLYRIWGQMFKIKMVDVVGFSQENVSKYVNNFTIDKSLKHTIHRKIVESPNLTAMSRIPIYLSIVCSVFEDNRDIPAPETHTELYIWAFAVFLKHHFKDTSACSETYEDRSLNEIFTDERYRNMLKTLSRLSYEMFVQNKVIFSEADLNSVVEDFRPVDCAGFIVCVRKNEVEGNVYQFRHLVLQEFLVACYVISNGESIPQVDQFLNVIPIIAGLQGGMIENSKSELLKCFTKSLELVYRAPIINEILTGADKFYCLISSVFEFDNPLHEQSRLTIVSQMRRCDIKITIIHHHVLNYFVHFLNQMKLKEERSAHLQDITIQSLKLSQCQLHLLSATVFVTSHLCFQYIEIVENEEMGASGRNEGFKAYLENIAAREAQYKADLRNLTFWSCHINDEQTSLLARAVPYVQHVQFHDITLMGTAGLKVLAEEIMNAHSTAVQNNKAITLQRLNISSCNLNEEQMSVLANAVPYIQHVEVIHNPSMGTAGLKVLAEEIRNAHNTAVENNKAITLQHLTILLCNLNEEQMSVLANAVPYIQHVDVIGNRSMGTAGLKLLAEEIRNAHSTAVQNNKAITLQRLDLSGCHLNDEQMSVLANAVPYVQQVSLSDNESMGTAGLMMLVEEIRNAYITAIQKNRTITLQRLDVSCCNLDEKQMSVLANAVPYIQHVEVWGNPYSWT